MNKYYYSSPCKTPTIDTDRTHKSVKSKIEQLQLEDDMEKVDLVSRINGNFGRWQLRTVLLIFLCKIPSSWFMACIIYTAPAPRHGEFFCKPPPVVMHTNQTTWHNILNNNKTEWIKVLHPFLEEKDDQEFNIDFCNVFTDADEHAEKYFHTKLHDHPWVTPARNSNVIPCEDFVHHADFQSIITDFDLVCSRSILTSVTQFFHLFGVLTGGIIATNLLKQ